MELGKEGFESMGTWWQRIDIGGRVGGQVPPMAAEAVDAQETCAVESVAPRTYPL